LQPRAGGGLLIFREGAEKIIRRYWPPKKRAVKGEKEMDRVALAKFKSMLKARQQELSRSVTVNQEHGRSVVEDYPQDTAERANVLASKDFFFAHSSQGRGLLKMVSEALERIESGSYGQCASCEVEINRQRLEAVPWTRYCLQCQERLEQQLASRRVA
jgi:DnaK suppressor protein